LIGERIEEVGRKVMYDFDEYVKLGIIIDLKG